MSRIRTRSARAAPLFNIYADRSEGYATAMEEVVMHAGLYDDIPRGRELVWIMLANRAARGLASLRVQANEIGLDEAGKFHAAWTRAASPIRPAISSGSSRSSTCASPATAPATSSARRISTAFSPGRRIAPSSPGGLTPTATRSRRSTPRASCPGVIAEDELAAKR